MDFFFYPPLVSCPLWGTWFRQGNLWMGGKKGEKKWITAGMYVQYNRDGSDCFVTKAVKQSWIPMDKNRDWVLLDRFLYISSTAAVAAVMSLVGKILSGAIAFTAGLSQKPTGQQPLVASLLFFFLFFSVIRHKKDYWHFAQKLHPWYIHPSFGLPNTNRIVFYIFNITRGVFARWISKKHDFG